MKKGLGESPNPFFSHLNSQKFESVAKTLTDQ